MSDFQRRLRDAAMMGLTPKQRAQFEELAGDNAQRAIATDPLAAALAGRTSTRGGAEPDDDDPNVERIARAALTGLTEAEQADYIRIAAGRK